MFFPVFVPALSDAHGPTRQTAKKKKSETEAAQLKRAAHAPYFKAGQPATYIVLGARAPRQGLSKVSHRRSLVPAFNESRSESLRQKDAGGARGRRHVTWRADATPQGLLPNAAAEKSCVLAA